MFYRNFRLNLIVRVLFICLFTGIFFWAIFPGEHRILAVLAVIITVILIFELIRYIEKTNRFLATFLNSIRYSEYTQTFEIEGLGSAFDILKDAFNNVIDEFHRVRAEKEEHYQYLQYVMRHVSVSLLAYRKEGPVEFINDAAMRLFEVRKLRDIHTLEHVDKGLANTIINLDPGEKALYRLHRYGEFHQLAVYVSEFKLREREIRLVAIQDIRNELEEQELESWQKLIRVLTHEIMNSITPIVSLSSTLQGLLDTLKNSLEEQRACPHDTDNVQDIREALQTIHKRSRGLMHFVESYRNLSRIPKPTFTTFPVAGLFRHIELLMNESLNRSRIDLFCSIDPPTLELTADQEMIEQILINIIKNAEQALSEQENGTIRLTAEIGENQRILIQVQDNGPGILPDVIDRIFIPFFTTKQKGSGIGLSLARQIMRLHKGTINATSEPGVQTVFTLRF